MPSRRHSQSPLLMAESPSSQTNQTRAHLKADEVCVGCIVWLPRKTGNHNVRLFGGTDEVLETPGYHHPVVILGIRSPSESTHHGDLEICFAQLTTFNGLNLASYAAKRRYLSISIPIMGTVSPGDLPSLYLEGGEMLFKQSYVRLDNVYETNIGNLRSYNNNHAIDLPPHNWRLDETSYHKLMSLLHLEAQEYLSTDSVKLARRARNTRIRLPVPVPTARQNPPRAPVTTNAQRPPTALPLPDPQTVHRQNLSPRPPTAAQPNLRNARAATYPPSPAAAHSHWAPQTRPNSMDEAVRYYSDVMGPCNRETQELRQTHCYHHRSAVAAAPYRLVDSSSSSSSSINESTREQQLPLPASHKRTGRRRKCCGGGGGATAAGVVAVVVVVVVVVVVLVLCAVGLWWLAVA